MLSRTHLLLSNRPYFRKFRLKTSSCKSFAPHVGDAAAYSNCDASRTCTRPVSVPHSHILLKKQTQPVFLVGYANVGFHDDEPITPHIDQLAYDGVQLDRFYTYKFCSPTRSSFMSGRLPLHVNQENHPPEYSGTSPVPTRPHARTAHTPTRPHVPAANRLMGALRCVAFVRCC